MQSPVRRFALFELAVEACSRTAGPMSCFLSQTTRNNIQPRARNVKGKIIDFARWFFRFALDFLLSRATTITAFLCFRQAACSPRKILMDNKQNIFLYYFFFITIFSLDFYSSAVYGIAILRQTAQQNGSSGPLRSAVRDCLGYTVRTMRKLFRLKCSSAGCSRAFSCAAHHRTEFQAASPKRFVPPDYLKRNNRERTTPQ